MTKTAKKIEVSPAPTVITDAAHMRPLPWEWLPTDVFLTFDVYVVVGSRYVLFRKEGDIITDERAESLKKMNSASVFVTRRAWKDLLQKMDYLMPTIFKVGDEASTSQVRNLIMAYAKDAEASKKLDVRTFNRLQDLANHLTKSFLGNPSLAIKLLRHYPNPNLYYANHNVNVAIFSCAIGIKLKYSKAELEELTLAGLVHNTGNLYLPPPLLLKSDTLTSREWHLVQSHTNLGGDYLDGIDAPESVVLTAKHHHERTDGGGYPSGLKNSELHPFTKICSVADVYDALISTRPHHRNARSPLAAIKMMQQMRGKFDSQVFGSVTNPKRK